MKPEEQYDAYLTILVATLAGPSEDQLEELRKIAAAYDGSYRAKRARALTASYGLHQQADRSRRAPGASGNRTSGRTTPSSCPPTSCRHSRTTTRRTCSSASWPRRPDPAILDLLFWISFATLAGLPATTAPVGLTRGGLPVGIQIMGPYLEDATPIDLAGRLADVVGGFRPPPGF